MIEGDVLVIKLTRRADGGGVLQCVRADGSITWQKRESRHAAFFALHDLTHFAVESTLGYRRGFYGLIAEGWNIEDTTGKGARGRLPGEAIEVEHLVGSFDTERAGVTLWTASEFNEHAAIRAASAGRPAPRLLSDNDLLRVRESRAKLFKEWSAIAPGARMELRFAL